VALTLVVRLVGGIAAGSLADRVGRRLPLLLSIIGFSLCDGAIGLAPSFAWVLALRTLFGFFMGAEWTAGTTLAMENWPARSRGIASGILQGSWAIGYLLATPVYAWIVPRYGWRALFFVAAIPALLVLPIRFLVPESKEWQHGAQKAPRVPLGELLRRPGWLATISWSSIVMVFGFGVYYAVVSLYPTMLRTELGLDHGSVATLVALFNVGMLIGSIATGTLAAKRGIMVAIVAPALLALPCLALYAAGLHLGAFLTGAIAVGFCGVTPLLLTSLFTPDIRARSVGLVYNIGAIPAAFIPYGMAAASAELGISLAKTIAFTAGACELLLVIAILAGRAATRPAVDAVPVGER
jgi:SHS family lactate transporter-like MFS transporter